MRQTQHPLSNGDIRKHVIDEMRRALSHPATAAPWAKAAALAREGHKAIQPAGGAPKAREAAGQTAAAQEVAELLLDEPWEPVAVPQRRGVRAEGLEVIPDDCVQ